MCSQGALIGIPVSMDKRNDTIQVSFVGDNL